MTKKELKLTKCMAIVGTGLGILAGCISSYANYRTQEILIEEKIDEALGKRENETES